MNFKNIPQAVRTFSIVEAEGLGELPSPSEGSSRTARGVPWWLAVAAAGLLLIAGGGAFLAYPAYLRRQARAVPAARPAARKHAPDQALARSAAEGQKA